MTDLHLISRSPADTLALGERIGKAVEAGDLLALYGGLGAGKTVLVKGIVRGLGGDPDRVTSPTFVLMVRHEARLPLFHFDAYRLRDSRDMLEIGAEEVFYGDGVTVVEWAERVQDILPSDRLDVHVDVIAESERQVRLLATGPRSAALLSRLQGG